MSIATEISRLQTAKADIKTAIEGKGVSVPSSAKLDDYADYIELIQGGDGLTNEVKDALLDLARNIAYTTPDAQELYDALFEAFYPVTSISAVFNQGDNVIYDTDSLDDLKQYLTVTAYYDDGTSGTVTGYTLSGTLEEGTSTITVSYGGKTTAFNVTVTGWTWVYNASDGQTLTQRTDIVTKNITAGSITEELVDNTLHIYLSKASNGCKWDFVQTTNNNAILEIRFKFTGYNVSTSFGGFQPQLSNGTGGAKFGISKQTSSGAIKCQTAIGETVAWHDITENEWHVLKMVLENNKQSVYLDGDALVENANICTVYNAYNRIFVQNNGASAATAENFYIDYVRYKNNDL